MEQSEIGVVQRIVRPVHQVQHEMNILHLGCLHRLLLVVTLVSTSLGACSCCCDDLDATIAQTLAVQRVDYL